MRLWRFNSITLYCEVRVNPVRAYYLTGRDAAVAARALIKLPMMYSALTDIDAAIVFGQPPPGYLAAIYQLLSQLDVEMPYGEIVLDPADITAWLNPYWAFTDGREWIWPEEARARVLPRQVIGWESLSDCLKHFTLSLLDCPLVGF